MFNNQYNRHIADEVARIDRLYVMHNELHGEGKKQQHKLGFVSDKEEAELLNDVEPILKLAPPKNGRGRPKKHSKKGKGDFTDMEGGGFWGDVWHGVKKGVSGVAEIAPDIISLAGAVGLGKPKTRGRPKKVGSAMYAGAMSAGAMSAGAMSAGAMSAGAKKYKKKKVAGAMSAGAMSAGAMSAGGKKVAGKISRKERGEAVKAMMKKHNVSLGEASKMVSKHLKGGGFFKSLLHLAPLVPLLL
jgi:hypothetical protein